MLIRAGIGNRIPSRHSRMANAYSNSESLTRIRRSSDGYPVHPGHAHYHIFRLIIGSAIGGWTVMMVFIALGFLGSIDFVDSVEVAVKWILVGGTILGIIYGTALAIIAGLLVNVIPPLGRSVHPLALVRAGFLIAIVWPLAALAGWPATGWGLIIGPILAALIAFPGIVSNRHAELVPHSTIGRGIGTAIGPALIMGLFLVILIPMFNRGYGSPQPLKLVVVAVDGLDSALFNEYMNAGNVDRFPVMSEMKSGGCYGALNCDEPLIPSRAWADTMTGTSAGVHGILDSHSSRTDLSAATLWDALAWRGYKIGLFQAAPEHPLRTGNGFDIPPPESPDIDARRISGFLACIRSSGHTSRTPNLWQIVSITCRLARLGVRLDTISDIGHQILIEILTRPSPRLVYQQRKLLEFRIESDIALALVRKHPLDAAILRFPGLQPVFMSSWRYAKPNEFGPPPPDVDSGLAYGLGRAIPDAYAHVDKFVGHLAPFTDNETVVAVISNHGMRAASDRRHEPFKLSAERLIEAIGWGTRVVGDFTDDGICIHPVDPEDETWMDDLENTLATARWTPTGQDIELSSDQRTLLAFTRLPDCLEVSLHLAHDLTRDAPAVIGDWEGTFSELIEPGETPSGQISQGALMLISGPQFSAGHTARSANLRDFTPTILHALGIEISEQMTGRIMEELLNPPWLRNNPPRYVESYAIPEEEEEPEEVVPPGDGVQPSVNPVEGVDLTSAMADADMLPDRP